MRDDDLDRILSTEPEIVPSSGFVVSVMDAVRRETAPPPIPFPWKRALPGFAAAGFALVALFAVTILLFARGIAVQPLPPRLLSALASMLEALNTVGASWIVLALLMSFASMRLATRLASGRT